MLKRLLIVSFPPLQISDHQQSRWLINGVTHPMMTQEKKFDAIVIGAGPAGSTAAYLLAKSGLQVLVLDKKVFPRDKLCGGLLTRKTVRFKSICGPGDNAEPVLTIMLPIMPSSP